MDYKVIPRHGVNKYRDAVPYKDCIKELNRKLPPSSVPTFNDITYCTEVNELQDGYNIHIIVLYIYTVPYNNY